MMDMGSSTTRLWLSDGYGVCGERRAPFGARLGKLEGREALVAHTRALIGELLDEHALTPSSIECLMVSGMAGSEMGLCDVARIPLPVDVFTLADALTVKSLPEIAPFPFVFVPGLCQMRGTALDDVIRGEETEVAGILSALSPEGEVVLLLPGTHNKVICVDAQGRTVSFRTTMSGELLDGIVTASMLKGQVSHDFTVSDADVLQGARYAEQNGLSAALFHVRVMGLNGQPTDVLSSFLYGAVLSEDIALIRRVAGERPIHIGGRETLQRVYGLLLGAQAMPLDSAVAGGAVQRGLEQLYRLHAARTRRDAALAAIERERLIAIVRQPDGDTFLSAMQALYDGGVRLAEVTFDRSGNHPKTETAAHIRALVETFGDRMPVGAGTVTCREDVMLAYEAGASFIISPNCDTEIIRLARALGLVSIPAAFTPTEIAAAMDAGADYVKLFPADAVGSGYVKAVTAPLSDAKLLAVGGVTVDNAGEFIARGFCGVGIGSNLYDKKLIRAGDFAALTALARDFVQAVKG